MKTPQEIAQWVIANRYPKSENDKISDIEMYVQLVDDISILSNDKKYSTVDVLTIVQNCFKAVGSEIKSTLYINHDNPKMSRLEINGTDLDNWIEKNV